MLCYAHIAQGMRYAVSKPHAFAYPTVLVDTVIRPWLRPVFHLVFGPSVRGDRCRSVFMDLKCTAQSVRFAQWYSSGKPPHDRCTCGHGVATVLHHGLMSVRLDVCAVGVYLRQVGGAVADEVDEHVSIAS